MRVESRAATRHAALACLPLIAAVLGLSGCDRETELRWAPDARTASDIMAVLSGHGIVVERKAQKDGVMLSVAASDFPRATRALREAGLLRAARPSMDEALGKRGIAPTPLEERARRVHAICRELEATLMQIDGVVAARVSVVPPERAAPGAPLARASASVLIKHRADVDLSPLAPSIARLVKNGAPGLAAEDDRHIAVMLVPEQRTALSDEEAAAIAKPVRPPGGLLEIGRAHSALPLVLLAGGSMALGYFFDRLLRLFRQHTSRRDVRDDG